MQYLIFLCAHEGTCRKYSTVHVELSFIYFFHYLCLFVFNVKFKLVLTLLQAAFSFFFIVLDDQWCTVYSFRIVFRLVFDANAVRMSICGRGKVVGDENLYRGV